MSSMLVLVLAALIVVALVGEVMRRQERKRRAELTAWATSLGWTSYPPRTRMPWTSQLPGRNRSGLTMLFCGVRGGRTVAVAEYVYTETRYVHTGTRSGDVYTLTGDVYTWTSGGHTQRSAQTVSHPYLVCVVSLTASYPFISVVERGMGSKLWHRFGGGQRTELGITEFDERFRISTSAPALARQIISPALVNAHLSGEVPAWQLAGTELLAFWPGRLSPDRALAGVDSLLRVVNLLGWR